MLTHDVAVLCHCVTVTCRDVLAVTSLVALLCPPRPRCMWTFGKVIMQISSV